MPVTFDESRNREASLEIDHPRRRPDQSIHGLVRSHRDNPAAARCQPLRLRRALLQRDNLAVVQY
jgi:hypothetical protein